MAATHKFFFILTNALLEWILIIMLLFNSIFSYLIRKFATYYTLKPPCVLCSNVDNLFDPKSNVSTYQNLVCEGHATQILSHYDCLYRRMNFQAMSVNRSLDGASHVKPNYKENGMVGLMDVPVENKCSYIQVFDHIIPLEWTDSSTSCSRNSSLNGDEDDDQVENQVHYAEAKFSQTSCCQDEEDKEDKVATIDSLIAELKAERLVSCGLHIELDEERKASAVVANQAMIMITKLQEEKIALHTEYIQNQRMMDEQAEYDKEVVMLLNEIVMKLENDIFKLQNKLETYKEKVLNCEEKPKAKMMSQCSHASCSITKELLADINVVLTSDNLKGT